MKRLVLLLSFTTLAACTVDVAGKKVVDTGGGKSESLSYDYTVNGCATGQHTFSSKQAYCDGLKDSSLNHGCATSMRYDTFMSECPGQSWQ